MKCVATIVIAGLFVASAVFAQSSEKDILDAKNACRERVKNVNKSAVLKWWWSDSSAQEAGLKPEPTSEESLQQKARDTEVTSHWSLKLHTCLAILETRLENRSWGSIVLDATEMRLVANGLSFWHDNEQTFLGHLYVPTTSWLTEADYRRLIRE